MAERERKLDDALAVLRERDIDPSSAGGAVALEFLLGSDVATPSAPAPSGTVPLAIDEADPLAIFADWAKVDSARLADFFEFSEGRVHLTIPSTRLPRSKADRQRLLTLLVLAAERIGLKVERTHADPIIAVLHDYAVFDQNMSGNMSKIANQITRSGKPKDYVYRITQPGLDRAKQLLQELVSSEDEALTAS
jgi:hypothetical protein